MKMIKVEYFSFMPNNFTGIAEDSMGTKCWFVNGKRHRDDGPAVEHSDGTRHWYCNGKVHRMDGPAIEWQNGVCPLGL